MKKDSQKIKILYLHAGAELYGADKILLEILNNIDKNVFEPIVLLPNDGVLREEIEKIGIEVHILNYPILRRKYFTPRGIIKYMYEYFKYGSQISKFVSKQDIDLVHVNTTAVLEGTFIKVRNRVPVVWHVHEIIISPKIIFKFISLMVRWFSDTVITVSAATKNRLVESKLVNPDEIQVIYNGISTTNIISENKNLNADQVKKDLGIPENALIVGMIGRVNAWKGQADFLKAMEIVLAKDPNFHAILVGSVFSGEEFRMEKLKSIVQSSPFKSQIHLVEFTKDVASFYATFDIFVLPSINPDPLPTVVLEAMANSLPIVGYNHGGIVEMVDKTSGILVVPRDTDILAKEILSLLENESLRNKLGAGAQKRQHDFFNLDTFVTNIEKIYSELV